MKICICLLAAAVLVGAGCAHPAVGGSQGDNLESYSSSYTQQGQEIAGRDYRQILSDPGPF